MTIMCWVQYRKTLGIIASRKGSQYKYDERSR